MTERSKDHVERAQAKLLTQYRRPKIKAWLAAYIARVQELEDACWEIIDLRNLADAEGVQLDTIGKIVGRGRNNLSDDHYRLALAAQIRINRSRGKTIDLTDVFYLSVPLDTEKRYRETSIATAIVTVGPGDYDLPTLVRNLTEAKALGVKLFIVVLTEDNFGFKFSSVYATQVADNDHGWGTVYSHSVGGKMAHVIGV